MKKSDLLKKTYELSVTIKTNKRYRKERLRKYKRRDRAIRAIVGLVTTLGAVATLSGQASSPIVVPIIGTAAALFAYISLFSAVVLNIYTFQEEIIYNYALLGRWSELAKAVDEFWVKVQDAEIDDSIATENLGDKFQKLISWKGEIDEREGDCEDKNLLEICLIEEERTRGVLVAFPYSRFRLFPRFAVS